MAHDGSIHLELDQCLRSVQRVDDRSPIDGLRRAAGRVRFGDGFVAVGTGAWFDHGLRIRVSVAVCGNFGAEMRTVVGATKVEWRRQPDLKVSTAAA